MYLCFSWLSSTGTISPLGLNTQALAVSFLNATTTLFVIPSTFVSLLPFVTFSYFVTQCYAGKTYKKRYLLTGSQIAFCWPFRQLIINNRNINKENITFLKFYNILTFNASIVLKEVLRSESLIIDGEHHLIKLHIF